MSRVRGPHCTCCVVDIGPVAVADNNWFAPAGKKRAENKDQQLQALLARIDELEAEKQQLKADKQQAQGEVAAARSHISSVTSSLASVKQQLLDARNQHSQEVEALKQQLASAQHLLQRTQSSSFNNTAEVESLRHQAGASKAAADAAQALASQLQQKLDRVTADQAKSALEKKLLLQQCDTLLELNEQLQAKLAVEQQVSSQC
jgi:DNA repair exonuclease SbcCD ATPase subunit